MKGGSTDDSVEITRRFSSELTYWISERDDGQSHAINKWLSLATGDILCWLNSDDYFEPNCLQIVANYFLANPTRECVAGACNLIYIDDSGKLVKKDHRSTSPDPHRAIYKWKAE